MDITIYFRRPKPAESATTIPVMETGVVLQDYGLKSYSSGPFQLLGFDTPGLRDPSEFKVLATMLIPKYFEQVHYSHEIHGHVLISIGRDDQARLFFADLAHGSHGCPKLVPMEGTQFFTFNRMRFYPFIMTDFTVGYYVKDSPPQGRPDDNLLSGKLAIDYPIQYDSTLGLYVTRGAHFVE
jgi:hypothetical protein